MDAEEKPLHVRVAEALGWEWGTFVGVSILMPPGRFEREAFPGSSWERGCTGTIKPPEEAFYDSARGYPLFPPIPRYDTDWAATGPLVERFRICLRAAPGGAWGASLRREFVDDPVPQEWVERTVLLAVCNLILALHEAGRLPR